MVEVLVGEECEGDCLWAWLDSEFGDVCVESTISIDTDVCWFFPVDSDGDSLWFYVFVVKRQCCDTHKSSSIAIQVDDRSAIIISICCGSNWCGEDESCPFDGLVYGFALYVEVEIIDKVFSDDDIVDGVTLMRLACVIFHGYVWQ